MIAAIEKAESLHRYALHSGMPLNTWVLVLSQEEAMELLEWYAAEFMGNAEFDLDLSIARRTKNPWSILENFQLEGLEMMPAKDLH